MPQWASILLGAGLSLFATTVVTYLSSYLTLRKSREERWWNLKVEAYSKIIEALHHAENCSAEFSDAEENQTEWEFTVEKKKQLRQDYDKALRDLQIATGVGAYIISTEAADVLAEVTFREKGDVDNDTLAYQYKKDARVYKKALIEIRALARQDLGVERL